MTSAGKGAREGDGHRKRGQASVREAPGERGLSKERGGELTEQRGTGAERSDAVPEEQSRKSKGERETGRRRKTEGGDRNEGELIESKRDEARESEMR